MRIRLATIDDAPAISRLVRPLLEKYVTHEFCEEGRENLLSCCTAESIVIYLEGDFRFHVAEEQGDLIGSVAVRANRHLFHLFVAESHWRRGIARSLWDTARAVALPENSGDGFTVNSSRYAVPVYRALGFVETGPLENRNSVLSVPMRLR